MAPKVGLEVVFKVFRWVVPLRKAFVYAVTLFVYLEFRRLDIKKLRSKEHKKLIRRKRRGGSAPETFFMKQLSSRISRSLGMGKMTTYKDSPPKFWNDERITLPIGTPF